MVARLSSVSPSMIGTIKPFMSPSGHSHSFHSHSYTTSATLCSPASEKDFSDGVTSFTTSEAAGNSSVASIFPGSSPIQPEIDVVADVATASADAATFSPAWYNPVDHTVNLLNYLDALTGPDVPFVYTIIGTTIAVRTALVPLYIKAQRNASRVAHMKPEMEALKARFDKLNMGGKVDVETQQRMNAEMFALFQKYDCNPMKGLLVPLIQAPIFMSMFFSLQKMPHYFADIMSTGGLLWFPDLVIPDPMYMLPIISSATFLATIQLTQTNLNATANNPAQANIMMAVFRGLGILMIPITINFPAAVLCYWITNNTYTFFLTAAFQQKALRDAVGIWELPKPVPGAPEPKGFQEMMKELMENNKRIAEMAQKEEEGRKKKKIDEVVIEADYKERSGDNEKDSKPKI